MTPEFTLGQRDPQTCAGPSPLPTGGGEGGGGVGCASYVLQEEDTRLKDPLSERSILPAQPGSPCRSQNPITCKGAAQSKAFTVPFIAAALCCKLRRGRDLS